MEDLQMKTVKKRNVCSLHWRSERGVGDGTAKKQTPWGKWTTSQAATVAGSFVPRADWWTKLHLFDQSSLRSEAPSGFKGRTNERSNEPPAWRSQLYVFFFLSFSFFHFFSIIISFRLCHLLAIQKARILVNSHLQGPHPRPVWASWSSLVRQKIFDEILKRQVLQEFINI